MSYIVDIVETMRRKPGRLRRTAASEANSGQLQPSLRSRREHPKDDGEPLDPAVHGAQVDAVDEMLTMLRAL